MKDLQTFWGLIGGYWRSDRWVEAWGLSITVLLLTTLLSKASVWAAIASSDFIAALAGYHDTGDADPAMVLATATLVFFAVHIGRAGGIAMRHLLSATLHRRARAWLVDRFNSAMLADQRIAFDLMSDRDASATRGLRLPDAIDQRVDNCSIGLFGGLVGLAMGLWGAMASLWFVSAAVLERSEVVPWLDRWANEFGLMMATLLKLETDLALHLAPGRYGSALLAGVLVVLYVPALTVVAWLIGKVIEKLQIERQRRDGAWRGELNTMLNRVAQMASSRGERAQQRVNERLYTEVDQIWHHQNIWNAGLMMFTDVYNFLSRRLLAYLPALPSYASGTMEFRGYVANSELTAQLIGDISWFIEVMPAIAMLRANAQRLNELAEAIERVGARQTFYSQTGISRFQHHRFADWHGLKLEALDLCHRGHTAKPFLRVPEFRLASGEWAYILGPSGCGKSALLKAIDGLWPYGQGTVSLGDGDRMMFAAQEPDIPERMALKSLITYPDHVETFNDDLVRARLVDAGLSEFIPHLQSELYHGLSWRRVLSGGQKQKLVLARLLLHRPDILLLDEATASLDPPTALTFYRRLKQELPESAVLAVLHMDQPPLGVDGQLLFDIILEIKDGIARPRPTRRQFQPVIAS